jgi:GWxTD domain-containing protein
MGIGFTRLANFAYAQAALEHAFNNLNADDRLSFTTVAGILSPEQLRTYSQLDGEEQARFEKTYWKELDPLYLTKYNERVLTHLTRIAGADLLFGLPEIEIRGWETDRGRIYIRYGEPRRRTKMVKAIGLASRGVKVEIKDTEQWSYPGFSLTFEDHFFSGKYRFDNDTTLDYDGIIKEQPAHHLVDFKDRRFDFPYTLSTFDDREPDRTLVEVNLGIPAGRFHVDDQLDEIRLKTGVFIFDDDWNTISENIWDKEFQVPDNFEPEPDEYLHLVQQELVSVPPGSYNLAVEVADRNGDSFGSHHITFAVPDYSGDEFRLGDLALALGTDVETGSAYNRNDITVEPNPLMVFNRSDDLSLYFGVYNLSLDGTGRTNYRVTTSVARIDTVLERRSAFVRFLNNLLGRESEGLSISSKYRGTIPDEIRVQTFDLSSLMTGLYKIEVTATDLISGVDKSREEGFSLIDRLRLLE